MHRSRLLTHIVVTGLTLGACGGSVQSTERSNTRATEVVLAESPVNGLRSLTAANARATIAAPPDDLVILDVRTPEEFAEGHIDSAVILDFYRDDFAAELAKLDPEVPYILYCRSGNRSGQTLDIMAGLGFQDVQDVAGGVLSWQDAGFALVTG